MLTKPSPLQGLISLALIVLGIGQAFAGDTFAPEVLGALIINIDNLNAAFRGFKTAYQNAFTAAAPLWDRVATLVPSTTAEEDYGWLSALPQLREWIGDRHVKSLEAFGYTIKNKPFEATVGISRDQFEDDRYGMFSNTFAQLGDNAASHPDTLVFPLLASGNSNLCFDGQYFFDTDHPVGNGTVSNWAGGSGSGWYLLDTRKPIKPLVYQKRRPYDLIAMTAPTDEAVFMRKEFRYGVDGRGNAGYGLWQLAYGSKQTLDFTNLDAAFTAMELFKDSEGRPLNVSPNLLVVGPTNRSAAFKAIESQKLPDGSANPLYKRAEILVVPWL